MVTCKKNLIHYDPLYEWEKLDLKEIVFYCYTDKVSLQHFYWIISLSLREQYLVNKVFPINGYTGFAMRFNFHIRPAPPA